MKRSEEAIEVNLKDTRVMLGMPAHRDLPVHTTQSMLRTQALLIERGVAYSHAFVTGCAVIEKARDEVVQMFLESDCTHLFWVDSDIVWDPMDFMRVLSWSTLVDVACAAYPAKIDDQVTFFVKTDKPEWTKGPYGLLEIQGIGLGFLCISREALLKVMKTRGKEVWDDVAGCKRPALFRVDLTDHGYNGTAGKTRSEDMAFCQDILDEGYKIYLDPTVDLGHVGQKVYRGSIKDAIMT